MQEENGLIELKKEYPDAILKELRYYEELKREVLMYIPAVKDCERCKKHFNNPEMSISVGSGMGSLRGALLMIHNVDSIKEIPPILKWFNKEGWHLKGKPEDYAELKRRSWELQSTEKAGSVIISAFFEGETCRFIEVGKEEKPIYELKCSPGEIIAIEA